MVTGIPPSPSLTTLAPPKSKTGADFEFAPVLLHY